MSVGPTRSELVDPLDGASDVAAQVPRATDSRGLGRSFGCGLRVLPCSGSRWTRIWSFCVEASIRLGRPGACPPGNRQVACSRQPSIGWNVAAETGAAASGSRGCRPVVGQHWIGRPCRGIWPTTGTARRWTVLLGGPVDDAARALDRLSIMKRNRFPPRDRSLSGSSVRWNSPPLCPPRD